MEYFDPSIYPTSPLQVIFMDKQKCTCHNSQNVYTILSTSDICLRRQFLYGSRIQYAMLDVTCAHFLPKSKYDAFFHQCCLSQSEVEKLVIKYKNPSSYVCYARGLCVYRDCLKAGLRFLLHIFIPAVINNFEVHPSQLTHIML